MKAFKSFLEKFTKVTDGICGYVSYFSMALIVCMMLLTSADVLLHLILNIRLTGAYEICQVMLSVFIFSSWAYVQTVHGHMHVVMFVVKMPQKLRFLCFGVMSLVSVSVLVIATYAVYFQIFAKMQSHEMTGNLRIPYWPFYIFEFVAFLMLSVVLLRDAIKTFIAMVDDKYAEEIQADWV